MIEQEVRDATRRTSRSRHGRVWLLLTALLLIGAAVVYASPAFRLAGVDLTGASRVTPERVMEVAGLRPGMPRVMVSAAGVAARLKAEPWVASAQASWSLNRLKVNITERQPVGLIHYYDLYYLALDESGTVLAETTLDGQKGLPVISGITVTKGLRGQPITHAGVLDALTLIAAMGDSLRSQVSEVQVGADRSLTLFMVGGPTVQWGQVPDGKNRQTATEEKVKWFGGVWQTVSKKQSTTCHIDMRVDGLGIPSGCQ